MSPLQGCSMGFGDDSVTQSACLRGPCFGYPRAGCQPVGSVGCRSLESLRGRQCQIRVKAPPGSFSGGGGAGHRVGHAGHRCPSGTSRSVTTTDRASQFSRREQLVSQPPPWFTPTLQLCRPGRADRRPTARGGRPGSTGQARRATRGDPSRRASRGQVPGSATSASVRYSTTTSTPSSGVHRAQ